MYYMLMNLFLVLFVCVPFKAFAEIETHTIVLKDHMFTPAELTVSANQKINLIIDNQDPTPEEFESFDFNREKIVAGNKKIQVHIGPLKAGQYKYFGEFHKATAQGIVVVK